MTCTKTYSIAERTTADGTVHSNQCLETAIVVIGENNALTEFYGLLDPGMSLTAETAEEALEWLNNGNHACYHGCAEGDPA